MSLETVADDIREQARKRAAELRAEGEQQREELLEQARQEADQIVADAESTVAGQIEQEREQALSSAKLEAKQARLEARRELLASIHDDVEASVRELDGNRRYDLTSAVVEAAVDEFGEEPLRLYGRADDQSLLEEIATEYDHVSVGGEVDCLGGVVVESEQSQVRVNNTFDATLETVWDENLREISESLFA